MNLWKRWIEYTRKKAHAKAEWYRLLYGTSFIIRKWWGFKCINPFSVTMYVNPPKKQITAIAVKFLNVQQLL